MTSPAVTRRRAVELLRHAAAAELATFVRVIQANGAQRYGSIVHAGNDAAFARAIAELEGRELLRAPWLDLEHPRKVEREHFVDLETRIRWGDADAWAQCSLFTRLYEPAGVHSDVQLLVYEGRRSIGVLTAMRTSGPAFGARDRRRLSSLVEPFSRLFIRLEDQERATSATRSLHLLLDRNGDLLRASRGAEQLLARPTFREALAEHVLASEHDPRTPARFFVGDVECSLVRLDALGRVAYLACTSPAPTPMLRPMAALTATQRRIAERAVVGATIAEIAKEIGCGVETVRSHMREIYRRLHVATRLELADALREHAPPQAPHAIHGAARPPHLESGTSAPPRSTSSIW